MSFLDRGVTVKWYRTMASRWREIWLLSGWALGLLARDTEGVKRILEGGR